MKENGKKIKIFLFTSCQRIIIISKPLFFHVRKCKNVTGFLVTRCRNLYQGGLASCKWPVDEGFKYWPISAIQGLYRLITNCVVNEYRPDVMV